MNTWSRLLVAITGPLAVAFLLSLVSAPPAHTQASSHAPRVPIPIPPPGPPPPPTPVQVVNTPLPTQVVNPLLPVQALNDTLSTPFIEQHSGAPSATQDVIGLNFNVPDGKRLVIESLTNWIIVPPGQNGRVFLNIAGFSGALSMESQGVVGGLEQLFGTHPLKLRVDAVPGDPAEIQFVLEQSTKAGNWFVGASIYGYLVNP